MSSGALPGSLYLALKYQHSLEEGLIANAGIGGDSAVRGMVIGMYVVMSGPHTFFKILKYIPTYIYTLSSHARIFYILQVMILY